jgi:hypothetical protein
MEKSNATKASRLGLLVGVLAPALLMVASSPTPAAPPDNELSLYSQITLPNVITSFDIGFVDSQLGIYILADRTSGGTVDVINTTTNPPSLSSQIAGMAGVVSSGNSKFCPTGQTTTRCSNSGPNGILIANHRTIWAGDGNSTLKAFNFSGTLLASIPTGGVGRTDEVCFDPTHQVVMATNDQAEGPAPGYPFSVLVNARTYSITHTITFNPATMASFGVTNGIPGGGAEQCQYDSRTQTFFIALPVCGYTDSRAGDGCVVEISPTTGAVLNIFDVPFASCGKPQGMAIGPQPQILLGCNVSPDGSGATAPTAIMDDGTNACCGGGSKGSIFQSIPGAAGNDEVDYNPTTNHYYLAGSSWNNSPAAPSPCGPGKLHVIDAGGGTPGSATPDADIQTSLGNCTDSAHGGSHSVAGDSVRNLVFVPMASTSGGNLCSTAPRSSGGAGSDTFGCIAIFKDGP